MVCQHTAAPHWGSRRALTAVIGARCDRDLNFRAVLQVLCDSVCLVRLDSLTTGGAAGGLGWGQPVGPEVAGRAGAGAAACRVMARRGH
jgi:hypothetical protein